LGNQLSGLLLEGLDGVGTGGPAQRGLVAAREYRRWARMTGSTVRVTFTGPNRFVSICARKSSGETSSKNPA
jgi:hypothetical protein